MNLVKKIILMTANVKGGIIQFTVQLYHILVAMNYDVKVCFPDSVENTNINEIYECDMIKYTKVKSIINKDNYKNIADRLTKEQPDYILYCDDSVICAEVGMRIKSKNIIQLLTLHDAGGYHPTNDLSIRTIAVRHYGKIINSFFYKKVSKFILLSPESVKSFKARMPKFSNRILSMNLGAHIPNDCPSMPVEMEKLRGNKYFLFFGRIDKYKGISTLIRAYKNANDTALPLVIAGNGNLSDIEKNLYSDSKNIILINRYIDDGEMKWLFENSLAVLLPYIEATQSGVIPISYSYGKPVIVSNIPGLTQYVLDKKTGFVCKNENEWTKAINLFSEHFDGQAMLNEISEYYTENMDWKSNIERMFSKL